MRVTLASLLLAVALASARPAAAQTLFSDNFNTGASPLWGNERGNWSASGGVYNAGSPGNSPPTYSSLPFNLTDFTVEVDINAVSDGGLFLRSADNGNGVLLVTGGALGTGTGLYWHVVQGGSFGGGPSSPGGLFINGASNIHLRVVVSGDTYSAYLNGSATPATTLTTNLFASGKVALYDFSGQTFDNFVLAGPEGPTAVPEPHSTLLFVPALYLLTIRRRSHRSAPVGVHAARR